MGNGPDADDFDVRLAEMREKQREAIRHEAFVQGFVIARDPKTASMTLQLCVEADQAYIAWRGSRG